MVAAFLLGVASSAAQTDPRAIVEHSVQAIETDWNAAPDYECFERDLEIGGGSKTFHDLMIMGSPYEQLVAVNDKPLSPPEQEEQKHKLEETVKRRHDETEQARRQRIAKYRASRERDHLFLQQIAKGFNFTLVGQQEMEGYNVYVLNALPRPGYQPPNLEAEVLKGMQGTLWVDQKTYQWVRVEARVMRPVWIEGFVAKVSPGTEFELDRMPVQGDIWLPKHFVMKGRTKILFFFNHNSNENETYYDYRKIAANQDSSLSK
jgi:phenolic acid decarboxylase